MDSKEYVENGKPIFEIKFGKRGEDLIEAMHKSIAAYASMGFDIVVDYILYDEKWINYIKKYFKDYDLYFIKVNILLEELEKREKERKTSPEGHARSHYYSIHKNIDYDFEVNTDKYNSDEVSFFIKDYILKNKPKNNF